MQGDASWRRQSRDYGTHSSKRSCAIAGENNRTRAVRGIDNTVKPPAVLLIDFLEREIIEGEHITLRELVQHPREGAVVVRLREFAKELMKFEKSAAVISTKQTPQISAGYKRAWR